MSALADVYGPSVIDLLITLTLSLHLNQFYWLLGLFLVALALLFM